VLVESQLRRVEEVDLPDLGVERIHAQRRYSRPVIRVRHGDLQLDAVGAPDEAENLSDLLIREIGGGHSRRGHLLAEHLTGWA
jgi:hypothetical protein